MKRGRGSAEQRMREHREAVGSSGKNWEAVGRTGEHWDELGSTGKSWENTALIPAGRLAERLGNGYGADKGGDRGRREAGGPGF